MDINYLCDLRTTIVKKRNRLVAKPLYLFRPVLRWKVKQIDELILDDLDMTIWKIIKYGQSETT